MTNALHFIKNKHVDKRTGDFKLTSDTKKFAQDNVAHTVLFFLISMKAVLFKILKETSFEN